MTKTAPKCTKMKNGHENVAKVLFFIFLVIFFPNMQICDVLRGCLSSELWMRQSDIRLIAMMQIRNQGPNVTKKKHRILVKNLIGSIF